MLLTIWSFCLVGQLFIIKFDGIFTQPVAGFTLAILLILIGLCVIPFHCFYKTARLEIIVILIQVMISPFSVVRFKHFLLADIITSFVNPLKDLGCMSCFFLRNLWLNSEVPSSEKCSMLKSYQYLVMFIPFWFRFAQSIRRYRDNKLKSNLVNAGKYVSIMIMAGLYVAYEENQSNGGLLAVYIVYGIANTIFCLAWDFYMDWGLLRSNEPGKRFLR